MKAISKTNKNDVITIPREEYEDLLQLKKIISLAHPTKGEQRAITRGEKEIKKGNYTPWSQVKHEMESRGN